MYTKTYSFQSSTPVLYSPGAEYGFVTEAVRASHPDLQIPEINAAFEVPYWYLGRELTSLSSDASGCRAVSELPVPLIFKAAVPRSGNYQVTVTIAPGPEISRLILFTGRRRLVWIGTLQEEETFSHSFTVNVSDIIPRGTETRRADRSINLAICGSCPRISEVKIQEIHVPTLYIAGDSTVTDQTGEYPYHPEQCYCGWGQALPLYLKEGAALSNHAHSGLTTESFREEGHHAIVMEAIRPGDFFFMQFGHNDQKLPHLKPREGYRDNLLRYIEEVRAKGAWPVLVTPLARNSWKGNDGTYNDLLAAQAQVCLELGRECHVPVLDLHQKSMDFIMKNGLENAKRYFYPGDYTHTNDYGGVRMAGFVAEECRNMLAEAPYSYLREYFREPDFTFEPPLQVFPSQPPEGFEDNREKQTGPSLPGEIDRPEDPLLRAEALDLIIQAVHFFPTNVYNDMYRDVVGHEWYAGSVECAFQNGMIDRHLVEEDCFRPAAPATLEEFLSIALNGLKSRVTLPDTAGMATYPGGSGWAQQFLKAALRMEMISGQERPDRMLTRQEANEIALKISAIVG